MVSKGSFPDRVRRLLRRLLRNLRRGRPLEVRTLDSHEQSVYLTELQTQCRFALNAMAGLANVIQRLHAPDTPRDSQRILHEEVFRSVHSFLTHASNASRLLWPPRPNREKGVSDEDYAARRLATRTRGEFLRDLLGLGSKPHPIQDRNLRDHLEHYDERLDRWRAESIRKNIASDTIGPPNAIAGLDRGDMMRWYDPTRNFMLFRGEEYDLNALSLAVQDLLRRANEASGRIDRQRFERHRRPRL